MQELVLKDVVARAFTSQDEEIKRIADLFKSHLDSLQDLDNQLQEDEFYKCVKEVRTILQKSSVEECILDYIS